MGAELIAWAEALPPALMIFARVLGLFLTAPVVGGEYAPPQVKALLALAVTMILVPVLHLPVGIAGLPLVIGLGTELLVGVIIGYFFALFLEAVRFGGDLIGRQAGFAAAEYFDPGAGQTTGPVGHIFHLAVVALFLGLNGHHHFLLALQRSFAVVPLGGGVALGGLGMATAGGAQQVFIIALSFSFPVMTAIMALTVADGVIARTIPQINLLMITFINKILITMLMLYLGVPLAVTFLELVIGVGQEFTVMVMRSLGG